MRPLDVLRTRRGMTVEVGNTDAEGRLVLCDLLAEMSDLRPAMLLDAATLTGAARVALGPDLPALFAPHDAAGDALASALLAAGTEAHDPLWRLAAVAWLRLLVVQHGRGHGKRVQQADGREPSRRRCSCNVSWRRARSWVHLDTYAWNDAARPGRPEGGEALGLRALQRVIRALRPSHPAHCRVGMSHNVIVALQEWSGTSTNRQALLTSLRVHHVKTGLTTNSCNRTASLPSAVRDPNHRTQERLF